MRTFKRTLSILLAIIMVLSLFTVIPVNAAEIDDDSAAGAATVYQIVVGKTSVTSDNCRNILGNNTASYDPASNTLTLNNPNLTEAKYANEALIYIVRSDNVTVKGSFTMSGAKAKCGIESTGPLTFDGNFTFIGKKGGAASNQSIRIKGGSLTAIGSTDSDSVGLSVGEGYGIEIADGITQVRAKGNDASIHADTLTLNNNRITSPQGAFFKLAYTVTLSDESLSLSGTTGIKYDGKIYAAEGEDISLTASDSGILYKANAGTLSQKGGSLTLKMPAENVTVSQSDASAYHQYKDLNASQTGFNNEGCECLLDGKTDIKWCVGSVSFPMILNFRTKTAVKPEGVLLFTANDTKDNPARNPISWKLEGCNDGANWTTLIEVTNDDTLGAENFKPYAFSFSSADEEYSWFRFSVNAIPSGDLFQLCELQLVGTDTGETPYTPSDPEETYNLWLGETQVTYANRNDILGDGGKAKFNPATNTLTLDNPTINGMYYDPKWDYYSKIFSTGMNLSVEGRYSMNDLEGNFDIYVEKGSVTLAGDFTLKTYGTTVFSEYDMVFKSGTFDLYGKSPYTINSDERVIFESGVKRVELDGERKAVGSYFGIILADNLLVTSPADFEITEYDIKTNHVVIEPCTEYDLWLGSTSVTNKNKRNILGDGKASYDVDTQTLTLDNPTISGEHSENGVTSTIYSADDLTIKGSCHTTLRNEYGVECRGNLTLDGDISIPAIESSYKGYQNITVLSGEVTADSEHNGISADGSLTVADGATLEINMKYGSVSAKKITLGEKIGIAVPEGGYISTTKTGQTILDADGNAAHEIYIREKTPTVSFEMNGHGAAVEAQVLAYGEKASEPKAPTADHCYFGGWFTDKECTKKYDFNTSVTDDIKLYAKWTVRKYTVTFVNEDNTVLQQSEVDYGTMPEYKGTTPIKKPDAQNSYEFTGWSPEIAKVTGEVTYKATFKKNARKLPIGDVNGDGNVTIDDATMIQKLVAELVQLTPDQIIAADTNCDGIVNIDDATNIQKYLAELIDHLG